MNRKQIVSISTSHESQIIVKGLIDLLLAHAARFNVGEMDKPAHRVISLPFPQLPPYVTSIQIHIQR